LALAIKVEISFELNAFKTEISALVFISVAFLWKLYI